MIEGIQVKICGLTTPADAQFADSSGVDYLGFNLHPESPRYVSLERYRSMAAQLSQGPKVAVIVEPVPGALVAMGEAGFERFQVHFRHNTPTKNIAAWAGEVGAENLWLAPKLPPGIDVPEEWLAFSNGFLLDTFDPILFGGTGRTGDWPKFRRHLQAHPEKTWILSGGLGPANVADALAGSGARFLDVNSGVESAPGVKDHTKLKAFLAAVAQAGGG